MSAESTIYVQPDSHKVLQTMAEISECELPEFMQDCIQMGMLCAGFMLENQAAGFQTTLLFEDARGELTQNLLDFKPAEENDGQGVNIELQGILDPFADEGTLRLIFEPEITQALGEIIESLDIDMGTFLESSVNILWYWQTNHTAGGHMFISTRDDDFIELGIPDTE